MNLTVRKCALLFTGCISHFLCSEIPDVLNESILLLEDETKPNLEFICLSNNFQSAAYDYTKLEQSPLEYVIRPNLDLNQSSSSPVYLLSSVKASELNFWLLKQPLLKNEVLQKDTEHGDLFPELEKYNFFKTSFLLDHPSDRIEAFNYGPGFLVGIGRQMIDFSIDQELKELNIFAQSEKLLLEANNSRKQKFNDPHEELTKVNRKSDNEEGFAKFALYLIIAGGALMIYSTLAPPGSKGKKSTIEKAEEARRKRLLKKLYEKGWIDKERYHFLLKRLENLPEWLGGINPPNQSDEASTDPENPVDLSSRKSGESVVKTKDTSSDNTSL